MSNQSRQAIVGQRGMVAAQESLAYMLQASAR
jgi:hypothetical protein